MPQRAKTDQATSRISGSETSVCIIIHKPTGRYSCKGRKEDVQEILKLLEDAGLIRERGFEGGPCG